VPKVSTSFKPGQSGNPGGRPKLAVTVIELARKHTSDAINTLATVCNDPEAAAPSRVAAAVALLDRAWGRPLQPTDLTSNGETVRYVVMGVPEIQDHDEWARRYRPKAITTQ
jgi:hypothetical protein